MREYSAEELDVMAEAYLRVRDRLAIPSPEIALRLVDEIGLGVVNGIRDEDALANAALERARG
jgi:hypothetical protein